MSDDQINHGSEDANLEHETDRPFIFAVYLCVSWTTSNHGLTSSSITKGSKSETLIFFLISISTAITYGLDGPGFESRQGQEHFLLSKTVQTSSGAIQPVIEWILTVFPGDKAAGA
jgi:hypothetical protein